ncbi:MAG: hypothetical protein RI894_1147 [Bacteroidota bacterium]|jgi:predicted MPP superfamily phosphohydrolase
MNLFRIIIPLLLLTFFEYYSFQAFRTVSADWSDSLRRYTTFAWWSIPAAFAFILVAGLITDFQTWNAHLRSYITAFFVILLLTKLVISLPMILDDFRRLTLLLASNFTDKPVDYTSRSRFLATASILLGALPFVTLTYGMLGSMFKFTLHEQPIKIVDLPEELEGLRVVQISDIHSGSFTQKEPLFHAIDMINKQNPDIVVFTGDLVNNVATEIEEYIDVFSGIKAKYGVFSVLGNHDYGDYVRWDSPAEHQANLNRLFDNQKKLGWDLMRNENRILSINGKDVALIGVENFSAKPQFPKYGKLAESAAGTENAALRILLSHDPSHWDYEVNKKPEFANIQLTLSGHTHGFQFGIEIPGLIKWSPAQFSYKQWAGLYEERGQQIYVNRGLGCLGYPGRVGIMPEITLLTFEKA